MLVIKELPGGEVIHRWQRAEDVDLALDTYLSSPHGAVPRIVLAMGQQRDCDEENRECVRECMNRPLPRGFGHITSGKRGYGGVGSVIIIAGVVFVVVSAGVGIVILAPAVLLATPVTGSEPFVAETMP